ncbi:9976_t:CDS:2, partial [Ambispora leptoticha]
TYMSQSSASLLRIIRNLPGNSYEILSETDTKLKRFHEQKEYLKPLVVIELITEIQGTEKIPMANYERNEQFYSLFFKPKEGQKNFAGRKNKSKTKASNANNAISRNREIKRGVKIYAIDCEMVGIGPGGAQSSLARVSLVNFNGDTVFDEFVRPNQPVTDYRTKFSGITEDSLENAKSFSWVRQRVIDIIDDNIVIGHSLYFDFKILRIRHPRGLTRDTSLFKVFRTLISHNSGTPSLKQLAQELLGITIQINDHDSVEDARTAMKLYRKYQNDWENWIITNGIESIYKTTANFACEYCRSLYHFARNCPYGGDQGSNRSNYNNSLKHNF